MDGLHNRAVSVDVITYLVCVSNTSYTLDNTLLNNRLLDVQWVEKNWYRYLLRAIIGRFQSISIGVVSPRKDREVSAIGYCCATDRIVKVPIESYLGHQ